MQDSHDEDHFGATPNTVRARRQSRSYPRNHINDKVADHRENVRKPPDPHEAQMLSETVLPFIRTVINSLIDPTRNKRRGIIHKQRCTRNISSDTAPLKSFLLCNSVRSHLRRQVVDDVRGETSAPVSVAHGTTPVPKCPPSRNEPLPPQPQRMQSVHCTAQGRKQAEDTQKGTTRTAMPFTQKAQTEKVSRLV